VATTREAFGLSSVRLVGGASSPGAPPGDAFPTVLAADGDPGGAGQVRRMRASDDATLELYGPEPDASEERLLGVIVAQIRTTLEHRHLADRAQEVEPLEAANKVRSALLSAVGHDVRRPLAAATAAVSGLRSLHDQLSDADRDELLAVAEKGLSDLTGLVTDLLDISQVQAGVFPVALETMDPVDALLPALEELGLEPGDVDLDPDLPPVSADAALLRRILVNLLANARRFTTPGRPVRLTTSAFQGVVEIRVIDHGPGLPADRRDEAFVPFQRLGDTDNTTGLGMGGSLRAEDTPGGGLTMVVSMPCAGRARPDAAPAEPSEAVRAARRHAPAGRDAPTGEENA
jgi:two-component system sensor histidine kinase KdpD